MAIKFTAITDFSNQRITNVADPSLNTDAATKQYVDNIAQGLTWKMAARVASTGNVNLAAPGSSIDGITLSTGDRVLLKNQTAGAENGIYVFNGAASALTRATDADSAGELSAGTALSVAEGTVNGDKTYILVTDNPITIGTTALTFSLMNGGSGVTYTAGNGIDTTGNTISIKLQANSGLVATTGGLAIDTSSSPSVARVYAADVPSGTPVVMTHGLNKLDVTVQVYQKSTGETVFCEVSRNSATQVTLSFASNPTAATYRVVVTG